MLHGLVWGLGPTSATARVRVRVRARVRVRVRVRGSPLVRSVRSRSPLVRSLFFGGEAEVPVEPSLRATGSPSEESDGPGVGSVFGLVRKEVWLGLGLG